MTNDDPPYGLIREQLDDGHVIPFLGAGASLGLRPPKLEWTRETTEFLPRAGELAKALGKMTSFPGGSPPDLGMAAQWFYSRGGRPALLRELHRIFDRNYSVGAIHKYLARVPKPLLIVTTNYDDLIERAFDAIRKPYDIVVQTTESYAENSLLWRQHGSKRPTYSEAATIDIGPALEERSVIYKMHGSVDRKGGKLDQYVITEDDYVNFLGRMLQSKAIPNSFAQPFQERHFLFLGYGLGDWNLRLILHQVESTLREHKSEGVISWAFDAKPSPVERDIWAARGVLIFARTVERFVEELQAS